jgi:hypothetical protein
MRIKIASILLIVFLLPLLAISQQRWYSSFGKAGKWELIIGIEESYDKGYLLYGGYINEVGLLAKTSINGNLLWNKVLVSGIYFDNIYASGELSTGRKVLLGHAGADPLIVNLNACGEMEWCYKYNNPEHFIGGYFIDSYLFNDGHTLALALMGSLDQENQIYLFSFDDDGSLNWMKEFAKIEDHPDLYFPSPYRLDTVNGNYFISGDCYYRLKNNPDVYALRPMFIKINENFEEEWLLAYGDNIEPFEVLGSGMGVLKENDSVYRGYGRYSYSNTYITSFLNFNSEGLETDFVGIPCNLINDTITDNSPWKIININDSLFMVSGFVNYHIWNDDQIDILNFVMSSTGNLYEHQILLNTEPTINSVIKTDNNQFVFTGGIKQAGEWDILLYKLNADLSSVEPVEDTITYDYLCDNLPIVSDTIYLDDCGIITDLKEIPTPTEYYSYISTIPVHIFPNPATSGITFEFENTEYHKDILLRCYDINGRLVFEQALPPGQTQIKTSVSNWQSGIYVAVANSREGGTGKEKFVVR